MKPISAPTLAAISVLTALVPAPATASPIQQLLKQTEPKKLRDSTTSFPVFEPIIRAPTEIVSPLVASANAAPEALRATNPLESIVGEIRRWGLLTSNWDDEGAHAPVGQSLIEAAHFTSLLTTNGNLPVPVLNVSGRAGLLWDQTGHAELEFLGDSRIAYYIECGIDKHKGIVTFDSINIPVVLSAILPS